MLPEFIYHEPKDIAAACELMADFGNRAKLLAGGTGQATGVGGVVRRTADSRGGYGYLRWVDNLQK